MNEFILRVKPASLPTTRATFNEGRYQRPFVIGPSLSELRKGAERAAMEMRSKPYSRRIE